MIAVTNTFTIDGIEARPVRVEADVTRGLPSFQIIGLPDLAVRETRERVRAALVNSGFEFPLRRVTVNLSPADIGRCGPALDLAVAAAILAADGQIDQQQLHSVALLGELALDGSVRPVRGALAFAEEARDLGKASIVVPAANGPEAALANEIRVVTIDHAGQLRNIHVNCRPADPARVEDPVELPDLADLAGNERLRHALEIAAAGGHSLLMVGPPGSGKTMAARRLPSILPPLNGTELLEVARIASASGIGPDRSTVWRRRPFRAPHHTVSTAGLIGSGSPARPGEITLAHRGVLYLDEVVEFSRQALEALRQPMSEREVLISRGNRQVMFPADFQLIAGASACACGRGPDSPDCRCSESSLERYQAALHNVLGDRFDLSVETKVPDPTEIAGEPGESSESVRERVLAARERMTHRNRVGKTNSTATPLDMTKFDLTSEARDGLNANAFIAPNGWAATRAVKLARTLADLADRSRIELEDTEQAAGFIRLPRPVTV